MSFAELLTNRRGENLDITRYCCFSEKINFFDYAAFGRVWYGAKYAHRVWEQFAHTFEKYFFAKIEKCTLIFFGTIFEFFQNLGTRFLSIFMDFVHFRRFSSIFIDFHRFS